MINTFMPALFHHCFSLKACKSWLGHFATVSYYRKDTEPEWMNEMNSSSNVHELLVL